VSPRRSAADAQETRERILATALQNASVDGLEGLTIGTLAGSLQMSKAGVIGPFGSRADLQRAVLERAVHLFHDAVIAPALVHEHGLPRLLSAVDLWIAYLVDSPFPNGCFVTAASCELDGRPGILRDRLRDVVAHWRSFLRAEVEVAQASGDLSVATDADDIVALLVGISMAANQEIQLLHDRTAPERARRLMRDALSRPPAASDPGNPARGSD
jgi:AcrR family transcriptional regulator